MRITERMGLVYTALFLTVSVAVITQNSESLMAAFRGESAVKAVDDIFSVRPGRDQRLFVLSNDAHAQNVPPGSVRLTSQPECGTIEKVGGSFVYSQSITCSGPQVFQYCIEAGGNCHAAKVVLKLEDSRPAIDSIAKGPAIELGGFDRQVDINGQDLEITNVRLGQVASAESTSRPVAGSKLARVAAGTPPEFRPAPITGATDVRAAFDFESRQPREDVPGVDVAANGQTASDATTGTAAIPATDLPSLPGVAVLPAAPGPGLAIRLAEIDAEHRVPVVNPVYESGPFGTACDSTLTGKPIGGGFVELTADIPCHPNTRVEIYHGKLRFAEPTSHSGQLKLVVPALDRTAQFLVRIPGEASLKLTVRVPDLGGMNRLAIQWHGAAEFDLQAFEFGASPGSAGHVWAGHRRSADEAARFGGGYITALGNADAEAPIRVLVYSYPADSGTRDGTIRLVVTASPDQRTCGQAATIYSHRSEDGRLIGSSGYRIRMPACGTDAETIVLKNAIGDVIIAAR